MLDALEQAIWARRSQDLSGLVHHSDRGSQYVSIRYTEQNFTQALAAVGLWIDDYNRERPHQSLKYRTPHEVRREALESKVIRSLIYQRQEGSLGSQR